MDRHAATRIYPILTRANSDILSTLQIYKEYADEPQLKAYTEALEEVLFGLTKVISRIAHEYPELNTPDEW